MNNPISEKTRGGLYVAGISVGILSTVAGPLMLALETPDVWVAVVLSAIGAVTTLLSTLARANLTSEAVNIRATQMYESAIQRANLDSDLVRTLAESVLQSRDDSEGITIDLDALIGTKEVPEVEQSPLADKKGK